MRSAAANGVRLFGVFALLGAVTATVLLPLPNEAVAAGLLSALIVIVVASTVGSAPALAAGFRTGATTRAVLDRFVPRPAQADPDARGHSRPRAPGASLLAV